MSLNIIVRGGKKSRSSQDEIAYYLRKENERAAVREKAGYAQRQKQARKAAKALEGSKGDFRLARVTDLTTYVRHEQERPGCWADKGFRKDFENSNPECKVQH
jgi:hypothetical protein|tara:strand:- start:118 stop:426 length:309 start_codon:yes stop_codon:yes gene_type:complete